MRKIDVMKTTAPMTMKTQRGKVSSPNFSCSIVTFSYFQSFFSGAGSSSVNFSGLRRKSFIYDYSATKSPNVRSDESRRCVVPS